MAKVTKTKPKASKPKPSTTKASKPKPKAKAKAKATGMRLELESGKVLVAVKPAQLRAAIEREAFAILSTGPRSGTYLQAAKHEGGSSYILEYQDGSLAEHFGAVPEGIPLDAIVAAFTKYLTADPSWRDDFTWERMKL